MWTIDQCTDHRFEVESVHSLAWRALEVAIGELGNGEEGGNNRGRHVERYRRGSGVAKRRYDGRGSWCAAFVSFCFREASRGHDLPFAPSWGAKRLWRNVGAAGERLGPMASPLPGDVACWDRGAAGSWMGHVGIVSAVDGAWFETIEGNRGRFPSTVRRYGHELGEGRLRGFARLVPPPGAGPVSLAHGLKR